MSQTFHTLYETNKMLDDVARHNDNYASLRSSFSGTSFPTSPTVGQTCWRTDRGLPTASGYTGKLYKFCGDLTVGDNGWVTDVDTSEVTSEVINSRGSKGSLDQRLDISLNEDGTLKATADAYSSEWVKAAVTFTYVSSTSFKTSGNTSDIFVATRRVKVNLSTSYAFSEVVSSIYESGTDTTTVTIADTIVDSSLVDVGHSIISPYANNGSLSYYTRDEIDGQRPSVVLRVKALEDLVKGDLVQVTSYSDVPEVNKYTSNVIIGVAAGAITNGNYGNIVTRGLATGIDLSSFNVGDTMYSDGVGGFTNIKPNAAYQVIGYVLNNVVDGSMLVVPSDINYDYLSADKAQEINTTTTYKDSVTGKLYKLYIENTKLLIEEL